MYVCMNVCVCMCVYTILKTYACAVMIFKQIIRLRRYHPILANCNLKYHILIVSCMTVYAFNLPVICKKIVLSTKRVSPIRSYSPSCAFRIGNCRNVHAKNECTYHCYDVEVLLMVLHISLDGFLGCDTPGCGC